MQNMCFINSQYVINMHANKQLVKRIIDPYTEVLPKFLGIQHILNFILKAARCSFVYLRVFGVPRVK